MKCPKCGGDMKVVSIIEQPSVTKVLNHFDLREDPRPPPLEMACEPNVDYVPWQDNIPETAVG